MHIYEAITRAGIATIIDQVQAGKISTAEAREKIRARLQDLPEAEQIAYRRLIAQVAMDMPAFRAVMAENS